MTEIIRIDLIEADANRQSYGILMVSATDHDFTGRGIHNRHHTHTLQVWQNKANPGAEGGARCFMSPHGTPTSDRYSFEWSPNATVIALRQIGPRPTIGEALQLGDVVDLRVHGYSLGTFQCRARPLHNPHMVKVDTSSSASRQHYIDTGEYLAIEE